jgi:hypothetical protein
MARARAVIEKERLVGRHSLGVADELQRSVGEVGGEVIARRWQRRLLDGVVVVHQVGIPLVGLAAQESIEPFEAA